MLKKSIIFFIFSTMLLAHNSPYSKNKFRNILNISKFQAPFSKYNPRWSTKYGDFKQFENRYFYLLDNKYMVFQMCEKKNIHKRSELRVRNEWRVSSRKAKILTARLKIFPLNQTREFTFLQIHTDAAKNTKPINKPLLRIAWIKKSNHIQAIIRDSINIHNHSYTKIDMGLLPKNFFSIKIKVQNSKINIWINKNKKVNNIDVSYWKKYYNYFKAGVYLQDVGCAKVLFERLRVL